jgi:hypothetical protein
MKESGMCVMVLLLLVPAIMGQTARQPQINPSDKFFDSNGVRIRYVESGRGEP